MEKIPTDLYYNLFTELLTIKDIVNLCNTNHSFKTFCLNNQSFIQKIKARAEKSESDELKKFLCDNDNKIKEFAVKNKFQYEGMHFYGSATVENKFTITLLYLVNNGLYDKAALYLTSPEFKKLFKQPEGYYIFGHTLFKAFPKKIVKLYMERLPPILDLFGYDNAQDLFEDLFGYNAHFVIQNKYLQEYIKKKLKNQFLK